MNLLAFETATPSGGVALLRGGRLCGVTQVRASRQHSRLCASMAGQLLAMEGLRWEDIDVFAASHGPGSFTGVRIALTLAKTYAWTLGRRFVSVPTMEAMGLRALDGEGGLRALVLLDARRGEIYGGIFEHDPERMVRAVGPPFCCAPGDLRRHVAPHLPGDVPVVACGEGALLPGVLPAADTGDPWMNVRLARADRALACPSATALLAERMAANGEFTDPATSGAVYLREALERPPAG